MMAGCGQMILGSDSHTRYGALGTMGVGEGGPELVKQLLSNTYDVAMPVSTKSLTDTLRHLEQNGILLREAEPTVPVTVRYSLTPKGRAFDAVLLAMKQWGADWLD